MDTLLDRFCRYVRIETTADENASSYPSSPGQWELAKLLLAELRAIGLGDATIDAHCIVRATIPPTRPGAPAIAVLAHLDTSPEFTARDVKPIVHRNYAGGDIVLPGDRSKVIRTDESPELARLVGQTLVTSDGTTLLGADDKAGVAVIMTAAAELVARRDILHGPIHIIFTCDEEIGRGVDRLDVRSIDAACAYTFDGESAGAIETETFSADRATVTITGRNIHPGLATGRMVNALRIAGQFVARLPWQRLAPETTSGRDGFLHPYVIEGGVARATLGVLLRSFETADLARQADILRAIAATLAPEHPGCRIDVDVRNQYRNMRDGLAREPRAVAIAEQAIRNVGLTPVFRAIRGGTDGSRLTELGLATPNLFAGMHNFHSPLEYACLEEMELSVRVLVELARLWGSQ
ncbi:MAG: peptidase T [Phycisphaerae bacterium]|nr:peptidase T [Phycisphaerae bacterium]MCZ2399106.1 peptidase T [Phycisphaerae bacterium]NUQ50139.1 peptidase T [Phycisphaerae bacterium]